MAEVRDVQCDAVELAGVSAENESGAPSKRIAVRRFHRSAEFSVRETVAAEEPLEIRIEFGSRGERVNRAISVTMRTPGHDRELAVGFLYTEGVIRDAADIDDDALSGEEGAAGNSVCVRLAEDVEVNAGSLSRNFYTTSSCGVCGKASLLALRSVCPPRARNAFEIDAHTLFLLPELLRARQAVFDQTGGLHAAALFTADGVLESVREDVGRHNALDKLIGAALLEDRVPLRDRVLMLSGRASFELLQKALMAGIPMVAAVGAPSSLAVQVAREFDITLIGFLRGDHFNVYNGAERIRAAVKLEQAQSVSA